MSGRPTWRGTRCSAARWAPPGGADPAGIEFGRSCPTCGSTDHGKPFATADAALAFSISRTRTMVGVAVGGDHPLGLDLEAFDAVPVGAAELVGLPADSSTEDVARQWVRVEAVLKSGAGLSIPPDAVRLSTGPGAARPRALLALPGRRRRPRRRSRFPQRIRGSPRRHRREPTDHRYPQGES